MKTPKELLLQRHENAETKLDVLRSGVIREHVERDAARERPAGSIVAWFRGLLWPSPTAWAGVAAAWMVIAFLNFSSVEDDAAATVHVAQPSRETLEALREQKRLFVELVNSPIETSEAEPPRFVPRPRSECQATFALA